MIKFNINKLIADCASNFLKAHPELVQKYQESLSNMITDSKRTYAMLAIEFTIQFMIETIAMAKKEPKEKTTTFE